MRAAVLMFATALGLSLATPAFSQPQRAPRPPVAIAPGQVVTGELTPLDIQRRSGKYEDAFLLQGRRGQRVEIALSSDDFDPYLLVTGPGGFQIANDDETGGETLNSRLVLELPADGEYRISATSFARGVMGAYRLEMREAAAGATIDRMLPSAPISLGAAIPGRLQQGDQRIGSRFQDRYRFTARRGDRVRITAASDEFDTVLTLEGPDGTTIMNDDAGDNRSEGRANTNSRIDTVIAEDGDYILAVSSYAEGSTGKYTLGLAEGAPNPRHAGLDGGRVLVVAVGVADYERMSDLNDTDDDARQLVETVRGAGLLHPASVVLTNSEATSDRVRAALARAAAEAGPNDLFLFFYSGHGDQIDVERSIRELDGRSETIELFDVAMRDNELEPLIDAIDARMVMVAIDACFAGGFRNLVNRPNVFGLFSSEEDLTSLVASRLEAGGYLSYYLRTGLAGEADDNGDRVITAGELSAFLHRRFRLEGDIPASTREDEANFQNLLVERGGIHVDDGVVRLGATGSAGSDQGGRARR